MGFLGRRRDEKWLRSLAEHVNESYEPDARLLDVPLSDATAQEIRLAVEARLAADWKMPEIWARLGIDYANARGDGADEAEAYAFTDSLVLGFALREVETARSDAHPLPADVASRLRDAPNRAGDVLQAILDLVETKLGDVRTLTGEAWSDFDYWAGQFSRIRSRGRKLEAGGVAVPATIDYEHALLFGYALRCCAEARGDSPIQP
jgi:hypothetical protein